MVGEMRDEKTAATSTEASHLHRAVRVEGREDERAGTVIRLLDMGLDPFTTGSSGFPVDRDRRHAPGGHTTDSQPVQGCATSDADERCTFRLTSLARGKGSRSPVPGEYRPRSSRGLANRGQCAATEKIKDGIEIASP